MYLVVRTQAMNLLAITTFMLCILSFFAIFVLWVLHVLGKVTIANQKHLNAIFHGVVVVIMTVSGGFLYHVYNQSQYKMDPYLHFFSDNRHIQIALRHHGAYTGEIDGVIGNRTLDSVRQFQNKMEEVADSGGIDETTLRALFRYENEEPFDYDRYFERVKRIQRIFVKKGFLKDDQVGGIYDKEFLKAVGKFESKFQLDFDHDLGADTLLRIVEYELNNFRKY